MSLLPSVDNMHVITAGSSLYRRLERLLVMRYHKTIVARLQRFRQELQSDMEPEPWTALTAPMVLLLSDVCRALNLTRDERAIILGQKGEQALAGVLETQFTPSPADLNKRQAQGLAYVQEYGSIQLSDYRQLCPGLSDETLRRDLASLVTQGLLIKNGRKKGTFYTPVVGD
jgi:hypothetical protein